MYIELFIDHVIWLYWCIAGERAPPCSMVFCVVSIASSPE